MTSNYFRVRVRVRVSHTLLCTEPHRIMIMYRERDPVHGKVQNGMLSIHITHYYRLFVILMT